MSVFPLGDIPGHDFVAPDIDHQVKVHPHPTNSGGQVGDVQSPDLILPLQSATSARAGLLCGGMPVPGGGPVYEDGARGRSCNLYRYKGPDPPRSARSAQVKALGIPTRCK